jgi:hypothetical protein
MSKLHIKSGSKCMLCDESLSTYFIMFHKTRRQTHSLCMDCSIGYLKPIIAQHTNNIRKNILNGMDIIKCPGSIHCSRRNLCKHTTQLSKLVIPTCEISLDVFRILYVLQTDNTYICPNITCGQVVEVDRNYNSDNLLCNECNTSWCRNCIISPYHNGKSCIEVEAENNNTENGKLIHDMNRKGKLKFCPRCRSPCIKHNGCFLYNTPILMWNGKIKYANSIIVGDELVGDDGNKRSVKKLISGSSKMYTIYQKKTNNYTVNGNHILVLKAISHKCISNTKNKWKVKWFDCDTNCYISKKFNIESEAIIYCDKILNKDIVNITVLDYLNLPKKTQKLLVGIRSKGINWGYNKIKNDPYLIGTNTILKDNNHIPINYIVNDRQTRLSLLAGIIDMYGFATNNGKIIIIRVDNLKISKQLTLLGRSLGFVINIKSYKTIINRHNFYIIKMSGEKLSDIPTVIKYKNSNTNKNYMTTSITIKEAGEHKYYGWIIEANHKFLLGDLTVVHNCNKMVCSICKLKWCWICQESNIDYGHYNSSGVGQCKGKLWLGVDENGNAIPENV